MDKRVIFATAGLVKTTYIVDNLSKGKITLIIKYTVGNYENIRIRICNKFNGEFLENITLMTYFSFLEKIMETDVNMLFVGDLYQHTFDTSRDGNENIFEI